MRDLNFLEDIKPVDGIKENIKSNMKNHRIKFVVHSHIDYMEDTLKLMLPYALREIPKEELMVIIGGSDKEEIKVINGVEYHFLDYHSFDYHSFVYISENPNVVEGFDYIFYLHDTCVPYHGFRELAYNFKSGVYTYGVWNKSNSNLGLYSIEYLTTNKDVLTERYRYFENGKEAQKMEDSLTVDRFDNAYNYHSTLDERGCGDILVQGGLPKDNGAAGFPYGYKDVYHNGVPRRCMFFKNLNLAKFKTIQPGPNHCCCSSHDAGEWVDRYVRKVGEK